jgi:hypothetical protein
MSVLPTITDAYTVTSVTASIAEAFTESVTRYTTSTISTYTDTWVYSVTETSTDDPMSTSIVSPNSAYAESHVTVGELVDLHVSVDVPLNCKNIRDYWGNYGPDRPLHYDKDWPWDGGNIVYNKPQFDELGPNPDIAGIGVSPKRSMIHDHKVPVLTCEQILLAFLVTACSVVLLAFTAYAGGFLPAHFLRRVDKRIFRANYRNQHSKWRHIIESVMISLSDQQLVTGFAILIAGYYEMMNSNLSIYHWRIVTYLAWLSSSVHIASLTLLRDVLNKNPTFRNLRVAGMLLLLSLLLIALWPTRFGEDPEFSSSAFREFTSARIPAKCFWTSTYSTPFDSTDTLDANWVLSVIMLLFAYTWKLSQLFASSRGLVRRWLVAKPEATLECLMRRAVRSGRSRWLTWLVYKFLTVCYMTVVAYAEFAESFVVTILYLCMTLPYGITAIFNTRWTVEDDVISGERRLTFGQLVPLFLLVLPIMLVFELASGMCNDSLLHEIVVDVFTNRLPEPSAKSHAPEAIHSLITSGLHRPRHETYPDLKSALCSNELSLSCDKLQNDEPTSYDPIVDHLMSSHAFKAVIWSWLLTLIFIGLAIVAITIYSKDVASRSYVLVGGAAPIALICPFTATLVLPFSRRLR